MSFEPTLILRKKDLENSISILEEEQYNHDDEIAEIAKFLIKVNSYNIIKFDDLELVICKPELTYFNELIREKLDELEIYFQIDY